MLTLDTQEIAELLRVSREHVTNKVVKRPDFPKPVVNRSQKMRQWARDAVLDWAKGERRSARASLGNTPSTDGDRGGPTHD